MAKMTTPAGKPRKKGKTTAVRKIARGYTPPRPGGSGDSRKKR